MEYVLEERIGDPGLFVGRKEELDYFLNWISGIKKRKSKSTAVLARRKMGKTALLERLYNITFHRNDGVIPFYFEVREGKIWSLDFCKNFFLTFIYQYIAFKTRKKNYLLTIEGSDFQAAMETAKKEGLDYLTDFIKAAAHAYDNQHQDTLWIQVREAPKNIAALKNEFIVQMIDEFQFLNNMICRDKYHEKVQSDFAAGYLSTAESKIAPLLVSGSWVGWLMNLLIMMLPARFKYFYLEDMPEDEAVEMIYKYSRFFEVPVTEEIAYLIARYSEGSPFYINSIICSEYPQKDLATTDGLVKVLEFETLNNQGQIKNTWMEYVATALDRVNDRNAKNIVLYLCKHRDREVTRKEILEELSLNMTDPDLEHKLKALVKADIISQGQSNFRYRGVTDNIFDKVFRGVYQEEIEAYEPEMIKNEYREAFEDLKKQYNQLQGKLNYQKGYFAEYVILDQLTFNGVEKNGHLKSITNNLPADFDFCEYENAWTYRTAFAHARGISVDILARAKSPGHYSIVGEIKNRDTKKFSKEEATVFHDKFIKIKDKENLDPVIGFVFSRKGFTKDAEVFLQENHIAYTQDEQWLDV